MDRSGAMPRRAWLEVRDAAGTLLHSAEARIEEGAISAECPAFPEGSRGRVAFREDGEPTTTPEAAEIGPLPTEAVIVIDETG